MKRRIFKKLSLLLCLTLLFCSLPVQFVRASTTDDSSPIFGLTPEQVVDKYNSLTDSQKSEVLKSLGNTSIFANSLFGNVLSTTFGLLNDAVEKIGDLFFQANGVVYHLGSSALAWVYRLIDRIFNGNLSDLNISQPVVDDIYLNTRELSFTEQPFFTPYQFPSYLSGYGQAAYPNIQPYPDSLNPYMVWVGQGYYSGRYIIYCKGNYSITPNQTSYSGSLYGVTIDLDNLNISVKGVLCAASTDSYAFFNSFYATVNTYPYASQFPYMSSMPSPHYYMVCNSDSSYYSWASPPPNDNSEYRSCPPIINITQDNYLSSLKNYLSTYFYYVDKLIFIQNGKVWVESINFDPQNIQVTNNTYYNYIYNIPNQTPLNINNIVSNTAINYNPIENIVQYLPDNYNYEQNFTVVNNYYISTGGAITTQGAIDVNLVSPSVIDVRIINPEDIKQEFDVEFNQHFDIDIEKLDLSSTVNVALNEAQNGFNTVSSSSINFIGGFFSTIPADVMGVYIGYIVLALVILALNIPTHKE